MFYIWSASYKDNRRCLLVATDDAERSRRRLRLPQAKWMEERLQMLHGGMASATEGAEVAVFGIRKLAFGIVWHGPLTAPTQESWAMYSDFQWPRDSFTLRVCEVFELEQPRTRMYARKCVSTESLGRRPRDSLLSPARPVCPFAPPAGPPPCRGP
ncbi:unnamed protein product [Prorocentrum cordatum]|uniref:Uncharacterized protein n=1 Tax=Prorocentrum cordatum TaxID=2364126 RepID=A0ABN9QPJ0_9DINO|nr:unnamed protein product [Polarella glacialis]